LDTVSKGDRPLLYFPFASCQFPTYLLIPNIMTESTTTAIQPRAVQTVTVSSQPIAETPVSSPAPSKSAAPPIDAKAEREALLKMLESELLSERGIPGSQVPDIRYNPEVITEFYQRKPWLAFNRVVTILVPCVWFSLNLWWDRVTQQQEKHQRQRAIQLRNLLTRLGPAYIKVGQALSTRPDLVPPIYLEELSQLQDQLPPFPNEVAFRFIEDELGDRPENVYAELSDHPIAAASLGQVYRGRLKTGEEVAVKVQRPGLAQRIALDLYLLRQLAQWATRIFGRIRSDLVGIMDEFGARIFEEMDYAHEGRNAERFAELYGHLPNIYVPKIYWDYTQRRVLTMEWINGTKLTQVEEIREKGIDAAHLVEIGVQCSLRQLLEHGFFHADPHPGNLFATPDGKLAYLDFGMMSEIKPHQRYGLIEAVVHLVNRDFEGLARDYVNLEFLAPDTDLTPIIPAFASVFDDALSASVAEMNFKSITDELSALMYEYPFRVPAYYALIIRSLVTLEGIAIGIDPNFKVLSKAYPYVAKRLLTDPSPELRASLRDLLFKDGDFRWNRLENLLRNAGNSPDYDLGQTLDQAVDFLFSERGEFIRDRLVDELVKNLDAMGRTAVQRLVFAINERIGLRKPQAPPSLAPEEQKNLDHIRRILQILRDTPGFDPMQVVNLVPKLITKPEVHWMGQKVASGLAQRAIARMVRELFLEQDSSSHASDLNGSDLNGAGSQAAVSKGAGIHGSVSMPGHPASQSRALPAGRS
jgi:predicted unusual protein kinase regulating ubiquinone biosynthesis (AarF/ABC1/UbiB family)